MGKLKGDLDLHKLEIFYWVAELRSFSQAAELLSLRQPTVSAHVQELEQSLGGKLARSSFGGSPGAWKGLEPSFSSRPHWST